MKEALIKSFLHVITVVVPLGVAFVLIKLLGVESPVAQGAIALVLVALEAFVRKYPAIPVRDFVNDR